MTMDVNLPSHCVQARFSCSSHHCLQNDSGNISSNMENCESILRLPTVGDAQLMKTLTMDWTASAHFRTTDAYFPFDTTSHLPFM
jgi:hypothetical protein